MTKETRFCDFDVLKNVLKFQFFSALKIKISFAQACICSVQAHNPKTKKNVEKP